MGLTSGDPNNAEKEGDLVVCVTDSESVIIITGLCNLYYSSLKPRIIITIGLVNDGPNNQNLPPAYALLILVHANHLVVCYLL